MGEKFHPDIFALTREKHPFGLRFQTHDEVSGRFLKNHLETISATH